MGKPSSDRVDTGFSLARRELLAAGCGLFIGFSTARPVFAQAVSPAGPPSPAGAARPVGPSPDQLDSFLALRPDGRFVAYFGKIDVGQGLDVAIAQIVAEELDVPISAVDVVQGDTRFTTNQGGASASTGVGYGGKTLRYAAAEARRVLVERAAQRLNAKPEELDVRDGIVFLSSRPESRAAYRDLSGKFETTLEWNGKNGNPLFSRGRAEPKSPSKYRLVGTTVPRADIRANVFGLQDYVTDVRVDGMLHARVIRPPVIGAQPQSVERGSVAGIPGVQVVHVKGVVAVLAPREWDAIRAADQLVVNWTQPKPPLPAQDTLYDHIARAPVTKRAEAKVEGDVSAALATADKVIEARYEWPFQSHASMGGACALADVRADEVTIWTATQKPHFARDGVAALLGRPPSQVRAIWMRGPGSYGRNDAGDAALEAAFLSREVGRPVRLQYTRAQGTGWDPKGPASIHLCKAGLSADGAVMGVDILNRGFSRLEVLMNESDPRDTLVGQLLGLGTNPMNLFGIAEEDYSFPAVRHAWETVAPLQAEASPLRCSHLRTPLGPQNIFAAESFVDELALATGSDPVAFRLRYQRDERAIAVIKAAAAKFGWREGVSGARIDRNAALVRGRGFAFGRSHGSFCALAVEIEVDRASGTIRPVRFAVGHDCGLIINPGNLDLTIEGNIIQGLSRALLEEVTFDTNQVTSVDWETYPILDVMQTPDRIDIVQINRPDVPSTGAGETATAPVAAVLANALHDATGIRLRRAPLTRERVLAALREPEVPA